MGRASSAGAGVRRKIVAGVGGGLCGEWTTRAGAVYGAQCSVQDDYDGRGFDCWGEAGDADAGYARSLSGRGEADRSDGGGAVGGGGAEREGLVLRVSEPGCERRAVDWADGGGDAEGASRRRTRWRGD